MNAAANSRLLALTGIMRRDWATGPYAHHHRIAEAALTALLSAYFLGPVLATGWFVLVLAHETFIAPALRSWTAKAAQISARRGRAIGLCVASYGSSIYLLGWLPTALTGAPGADYFAAAWFACSMMRAASYRPDDRLIYLAAMGPLVGGAVLAIVAVHGGAWALVLVLIVAALRSVATAWHAFNQHETLRSAVQADRLQRRAAEEASQAKSHFLATMSHELRTPLNAVIGYAEILEEDLRADGKDESAVDAARIRRAARDLLSLINEVLDFSKIEAGRMDIIEAPADVMSIVGDVVETCRHIADANGSTIEVDGAAIGVVLTDAARLRQCLLNLVSNACKFTGQGVVRLSVAVEAGGAGEFLRVEVADSGCGIAPEQAQRLFQPFVQAEGAHARAPGGTGLGLVITRKLAQLMGGDVTFTSALGAGSTFTLRVNVGRPHVRAPDIRSEGPLVVVIEDEATARDLICRALARLPFRVICANDAAEGLKLVRAEPAALIVLDIHLPDRSGWDVLAELKTDAQTRETPVLVVSIDDDRSRALALGACEHILKPADRDQLAAAALRYASLPAAPIPVRRVGAASAA